MAGDNFFSVGVRNRVVVVLKRWREAPDETTALRQALAEGPPMKFGVVVVGDESERVWVSRRGEPTTLADIDPQRDGDAVCADHRSGGFLAG